MTQTILHEVRDNGVAVLTLNRAPVNAISADFLAEMKRQLAQLDANPSVRAVVITSAFKVFSAGLDLKVAQNFSRDDQTAIVDALNETFTALFSFPKPVVTAASGAAIAGGLFFVLAADYAVTHDGATFGLAEVRVGANFPIGPLEIARATLPPPAMNRLMLSGQPVSAKTGQNMGFIDEIVTPEEVMVHAGAAAATLASSPPGTYASVKAQIRAPALSLINTAIANKSDPARDGWFTDETKTAMKAMIG